MVFGLSQSEHELRGKPCLVPFHSLIDLLCLYTIQLSQIAIEHDLMAADGVDLGLDVVHGKIVHAGGPGRVIYQGFWCCLEGFSGQAGADVEMIETGEGEPALAQVLQGGAEMVGYSVYDEEAVV